MQKSDFGRIETDLAAFDQAAQTTDRAVVDFETSGVDPRTAVICGVGVMFPALSRAFYLNVGHAVQDDHIPKYSSVDFVAAFYPFVDDPAKLMICHNANYELRILLRFGMNVRCRVVDTLIRAHRLDENYYQNNDQPTLHPDTPDCFVGYGLKNLTRVFFGVTPPTLDQVTGGMNVLHADPEPVAQYCFLDLLNTLNIYERSEQAMASDDELRSCVLDIDDPNNVPLAWMMFNGLQIDTEEAQRQKLDYEQLIQRCRDRIWEITDRHERIETPHEVKSFLSGLGFETDLGFNPFTYQWQELPDGRVILFNKPTLKKDFLVSIFEKSGSAIQKQVLALFLAKRAMTQRISAFLDPMPDHSVDGRLHPNRFMSTLVTTRFSSSPNLQNLPGYADESEEDKIWQAHLLGEGWELENTRNILVAAPGCTLVSADLKSAEPRYMACLMQRALELRDTWYQEQLRALNEERRARWPVLYSAMRELQDPDPPAGEEIHWPNREVDPLYEVFTNPDGDPYNSMLIAMFPDEYKQAGNKSKWLYDRRPVGKKAFLALGYGATAPTLAPALGLSVEAAQTALDNLKEAYPTIDPFFEQTKREVFMLGEVRTLWGRPRRINGFYQLARPNPVRVFFWRSHPSFRQYVAKVVPLGNTKWAGVQCFVEECWINVNDVPTTCVLRGNYDGTVAEKNDHDPIVNPQRFNRREHFNKLPFRNLGYNQLTRIEEIEEDGSSGLIRHLPRQERAIRQAFNSRCQGTGADHLRWLMNNVYQQVTSQPLFRDCRLVLTMHDSLTWEVPISKAQSFIDVTTPVLMQRPPWARFDLPVEIKQGARFGDLG